MSLKHPENKNNVFETQHQRNENGIEDGEKGLNGKPGLACPSAINDKGNINAMNFPEEKYEASDVKKTGNKLVVVTQRVFVLIGDRPIHQWFFEVLAVIADKERLGPGTHSTRVLAQVLHIVLTHH